MGLELKVGTGVAVAGSPYGGCAGAGGGNMEAGRESEGGGALASVRDGRGRGRGWDAAGCTAGRAEGPAVLNNAAVCRSVGVEDGEGGGAARAEVAEVWYGA